MSSPLTQMYEGLANEAKADFRRRIRREMAVEAMKGLLTGLQWQPGLLMHPEELAQDAVDAADALMAALERDTSNRGTPGGARDKP